MVNVGDVIKLGSLYVNNKKEVPQYNSGYHKKIDIGDSTGENDIEWRKVNNNLYIAFYPIIHLSYKDLNGFYEGRNVNIDGKNYLIRTLTQNEWNSYIARSDLEWHKSNELKTWGYSTDDNKPVFTTGLWVDGKGDSNNDGDWYWRPVLEVVEKKHKLILDKNVGNIGSNQAEIIKFNSKINNKELKIKKVEKDKIVYNVDNLNTDTINLEIEGNSCTLDKLSYVVY